MLTQLRLAGVLDAASAIVLGEFTDCDEPRGEPVGEGGARGPARRTSTARSSTGFRRDTRRGPLVTLPFGVRARVVANGHPRVIIEEAGVE